MVQGCNAFYQVQDGDSSLVVVTAYRIDEDDFYAWNPAIGSDAQSRGLGVCVRWSRYLRSHHGLHWYEGDGNSDWGGSDSDTFAATGRHGSGLRRVYYVQSGDGCWAIANEYGISLDDFYLWNPAVGDDCSDLEAEVYVCIGVS